MISLSSEITDRKGRRAPSGWVFYDADCAFCTTWARRLGRFLEPRGFALAPLQDSRVADLLALPPERLRLEMRVLTREGEQFGGADAFVFLARRIWWAWPLFALAQFPGVRAVLRAGYRWVAARRSCAAGACGLGHGLRDSGQFCEGEKGK